MMTMLRVFVFVFALCVPDVLCDYPCLCSYQVELEIFNQPDPSSNVDGYMYEFDCKPVYQIPGLDPKYSAVGNDRKLGYVLLSSNIQIQRCQGNVPDIDKVVMTTTPTTTTTTTTTTTPKPTTTPMPTTKTTTPMPTTKPTTPLPTTKTTTPMPTTKTTTPLPTTKTTTPMPTTKTTTPMPTTKPTTPMPTTKTTTPLPTTKITTPMPTTACQRFVNPDFVVTSGGSCYEFVNKTDNWTNARKNCHGKGGYLVSILNSNQQSIVSSFLQSAHMRKPVWIGYTDSVSEENWKWDSGMSSTYNNWMPGRLIEQYHNVEDCGILVPLRKDGWDDVQCSGVSYGVPMSYPWICQYTDPCCPP